MEPELFEKIVRLKPPVHVPGTERRDAIRGVEGRVSFGIRPSLVRHILETVKADMVTIETGCGLSTVAFAAAGASHNSVSMDPIEHQLVSAVLDDLGVHNDVHFVARPSEDYLPGLDNCKFNVALIDGSHAFPWPIIDWFWIARWLEPGGQLILDDVNIPAVKVLNEFLRADNAYEVLAARERWVAFRKISDTWIEYEWDKQPWNTQSFKLPLSTRVKVKVRPLWDRLGLERVRTRFAG